MTTDTKPRRRNIANWTTIQVTALPPGWRNVYELDDTTLDIWQSPAILLQEHRSDTTLYETPRGDGTFELHELTEQLDPPYETRTVFAHTADGWLEPADDGTNYRGTIGPDEDPNIYAPVGTA